MLSKLVVNKIKNLRKKGRSIPEISHLLNLPKSTVSRYVDGVEILPQYYSRWLERRNASKIISARQWEQASKKSQRLIDGLTAKELLLIGASLYWGEGNKKDFSFSNTDSEMIRIFVHILRNIFHVNPEDIVISIRIYEDLDAAPCLRHWSKVTGISLGAKTSINVLIGKKVGKLKYGMCRVRIRKGGVLLKNIFSVIQRIQQIISPRSSTDRTAHS